MLRAGGLAVAAALLCAPLGAQEAERAFSPEEDLDCAIYIGALMAEGEERMTPEDRVALSGAFTYFVGRYEAQRGLPLAQALAQRYEAYAGRSAGEIEQTCALRVRGFALRMQDAGRVMAELSPEEPEAGEASGSE